MRWILLFLALSICELSFADDPIKLSEVAPDSLLEDISFNEIDYQLIRAERIIWIEYYGLKDRIAQARHSASHHITEPCLDNYPAYLISLRYDRRVDRIVAVTDLLPYAPKSHFFQEMKWERIEHIEEVGRYLGSS